MALLVEKARRPWLLRFVALGLVLLGTPAPLSAVPSREYAIKAVFLFNFVQFVEWPPTAFASAEAPVCIAVLGDDPFGAALEEVVRHERVGNRPLIVRRLTDATQARECQLLFISQSENARLRDVLQQLQDLPVLTVGDMPQFAESGGVIGFATESNRIRLRVNVASARAARLKISSKLLRSADVVTAN